MRIQRRRDLGFALQDDGTVLVRAQSAAIGAKVPPVAVGVLAFFSTPREPQLAARAFGPQAEVLVKGLLDVGLLVPDEQADETPVFFDNFSALDVHRRMLEDRPRVEAYRRALEAVVEPGMSLLDAGTGSGLLAILGARAGAGRVVAVDNSAMLDRARQVVADSGLSDVVSCVRGDFAKVALEDPVDVVVTETFGALALAEGAAEDLIACCARNLKEGGQVIPSAVSLHVAPIVAPDAVRPLFEPWEVDGIDYSSLVAAQRRRAVTRTVDPAHVGHPALLARLSFPDEAVSCSGTVRFDGVERLVGLCAWFTLHLAPEVDLPTGPSDPATHWQQVVLPLELESDDGEIEIHLEIAPAPDDRRGLVVHAAWSAGQHMWRVR